MTVTTPSVWYANFGNGSSTGYFAVTAWHTPWTPTVGTLTRQTAPTAANERVFVCIVSGAVGGTEPASWVVTAGAKTTDSGATWMECTGQPALNGDLTNTPLSSQNRSGAQVLGNIITNNAQDHYFICTTAGTTGSGEPTFNTTTGATTTDSGCTWTCLGAVGSFSIWGAPFSRLNIAGTTLARVPVTGTLYVSAAHAETAVGTIAGFGSAPNSMAQVICIANAPSTTPPSAADITTGATCTSTASGITISGPNVEFNGVAFACNFNTTVAINLNSNAGQNYVRLRNSSLTLTQGVRMNWNGALDLINTPCTFNTGSGGSNIQLSGGCFTWRDTASAVSASGTWPTSLFVMNTFSELLIEGVDLTAFAGGGLVAAGTSVQGRIVLDHCKLASNSLISAEFTTTPAIYISCTNCDTAGASYNGQHHSYGMGQALSTTVIATGGASDGTTGYSWKFTGALGTTASFQMPFESLPINIWNTTVAGNRTITFQGAYVGTALPNNDQIWFDVLYFGTSSSTKGTRATSTKSNTLSSNSAYSASSTLWGSAAAARANTHVYSLGDVIGVSSGGSVVRAFVCTTNGTSSGSLPGAYASAVDGSQVTDGTAIFTAVVRFSMAITLSTPQPQAAGYLKCYIKVGLSNAATYPTWFIDPNPVLS